MPNRRTTFSKFIIEDQRRRTSPDPDLTALLNDIQTACKFVAYAVSRGSLDAEPGKSLDVTANEIIVRECEWGGKLAAMISSQVAAPIGIPANYPSGRYLLVFNPLDGSSNLDVDVTVGTIFAVLRAPDGGTAETAFLQPGTSQIAAGFALYGPTSMIVVTLGAGVHGFTLDREIGAYTLTHPDMRIPEETSDFAIDASNERFWEPPIRHYVEECVAGSEGARGIEFNMRWVDSLPAEVHRILVRGGVFISPRATSNGNKAGRLHLLHDANPMAMLVEEAGGVASTGRSRILDVVPDALDQRVPVVFGSKREVERLVRYHVAHDGGEELTFETPLFNSRSLFRTV